MTETNTPKVVIIEDGESWQKIFQRILTNMGVEVAMVVDNIIEATEEVIPQLEKLGVQFVLLDGNLTPNDFSGDEGIAMAQQIREQAPEVTIIGVSASDQPYADAHVSKGSREIPKSLQEHILDSQE